MTTCNSSHCSLNVFSNEDKCVLHCRKNDYQSDRMRTGLLDGFHAELIKLIVADMIKGSAQLQFVDRAQVEGWAKKLGQPAGKQSNSLFASEANNSDLVFHEIFFPERNNGDYFDYLPILTTLKSIHFNFCNFTCSGLRLEGKQLFFQDCNFYKGCSIYNASTHATGPNYMYQSCTFHENVYISGNPDSEIHITSPLFSNCEFSKSLNFEHATIHSPAFSNEDDFAGKIHTLKLDNCNLPSRFILNCHTITNLTINKVRFESKLEMKKNTVENFAYYDSNVAGISDFYRSKFFDFTMEKSIFKDFVGFEDCQFGKIGSQKTDALSITAAIFRYVTFKNVINFRSTKFHSGLDIERANFEVTPNFLEAEVSPGRSNRETFRIIKYSFDTIGNKIEANRFFTLEMKKYKEELKGKGKLQEQAILSINDFISDFGQSYIKPIFLIIFTAFINWIIVSVHNFKRMYAYFMHDEPSYIFTFFNELAANISPFSKLLTPSLEFTSLVFSLLYGALIWQTIVAIKRHTRR